MDTLRELLPFLIPIILLELLLIIIALSIWRAGRGSTARSGCGS